MNKKYDGFKLNIRRPKWMPRNWLVRILCLLLLMNAFGFCATVSAASKSDGTHSGLYFSIAHGSVQLEGQCNAIAENINRFTLCRHNDASASSRVSLGYLWRSGWAVEAGYIDLGSSDRSFSGQNVELRELAQGASFNAYERFKISGYVLSLNREFSLSRRWRAYGRAGGFLWRSRYDAIVNADNQRYLFTRLESGPDTSGGVGLTFDLNKSIRLGFGWDYYAADGDHMDFYFLELKTIFAGPW